MLYLPEVTNLTENSMKFHSKSLRSTKARKTCIHLLIFLFFCQVVSGQPPKYRYYKEPFRPQFHFTPPIQWTNDPNGLVWFNGQYHLFYQYNPFGNRWGHMSWGHAISSDLIHWQHLPVAIPEADSVMIFSGSCVVDKNNTGGFADKNGQVPMVAIYTGHIIANPKLPDDYHQAQYIAYSLDSGKSWTKYSGNPVLDIHKKDFRDPKVFWYEPEKKWVMILVLPNEHKCQFYASPNLKTWNLLSEFGPAGDSTQIWECPDLLQVPVEGNSGNSKWVLTHSTQFTMQYFVGNFDGTKFVNENPAQKIFRPDQGPDFYAAITYNNLPEGSQPVFLGWANSWRYANDIPTYPWKSAMALPRNLSLRKVDSDWILIQKPLQKLESLRKLVFKQDSFSSKRQYDPGVKSMQFEMELKIAPGKESIAGVRIAKKAEHYLEMGYDQKTGEFYVDRSRSEHQAFNHEFDKFGRFSAKVRPINGLINLQVFIDKSVIEIYVNGGETVFTIQIFPNDDANGIEFFSSSSDAKFLNIKIWELSSIW
ncbi:MAG: levanase [Bacteroidetes bacterium]|nr:MAG: levanase [Bacteroidota bacterium]